MKKKIIIVVCILLFILILILESNKTFFKTSYMGIKIPLFSYYEKGNALYSIRSYKKIDEIKNNYLNSLESCFDESYFYDKSINKSIIKYDIQNKIIKRIIIEYENGNVCLNEFVLEDDWDKNINEKEIIASEIVKCKNNKCETSKVSINFKKLINDLKNSSRIENDKYINFDYVDNNNYIGIYLSDNKTYSKAIKIIPYKEKVLGIIIIDDNDSKENALYKIDKDVNKYILSLVE